MWSSDAVLHRSRTRFLLSASRTEFWTHAETFSSVVLFEGSRRGRRSPGVSRQLDKNEEREEKTRLMGLLLFKVWSTRGIDACESSAFALLLFCLTGNPEKHVLSGEEPARVIVCVCWSKGVDSVFSQEICISIVLFKIHMLLNHLYRKYDVNVYNILIYLSLLLHLAVTKLRKNIYW